MHTLRTPCRPAVARGLAHVEVMVALVLISVALVPALDTLQTNTRGVPALLSVATRDALLRAKMEEVLAKPFDAVNAETYLSGGNTTTSVSAALSDPSGPDRRVVILYRTEDGSQVSTNNTGLVRVRVAWEAGGTALETLKSKWW